MRNSILMSLAIVAMVGLAGCGSSTSATTTAAASSTSDGKTESSAQSTTAAAASSGDKTVIKLGFTHSNPDPEQDDEVMYATTFKDYVEKNCDTLTVELYPGNALGSQQDTVGAVAAGTVEMTVQNSSLLNNYDPNTMVFALPGAFNNVEETNKVIDSDWAKKVFADSTAKTKIHVLGGSCTGMRSFTCKDHELRKVEDAKGLSFRIMDSPIYNVMVTAMSANPVPMPASEMYVAMQNGVVDGQENPIQNVYIDKTYEVQNWYVLDNHTPTVMAYMMNDDFYNNLTDDEKKVIDEANAEATAKAREVTDKLEASGIEKLEAEGMTVYKPTDEELKGWHDAYGPACEKYMREQLGDEIVDNMLEVIKEARK